MVAYKYAEGISTENSINLLYRYGRRIYLRKRMGCYVSISYIGMVGVACFVACVALCINLLYRYGSIWASLIMG